MTHYKKTVFIILCLILVFSAFSGCEKKTETFFAKDPVNYNCMYNQWDIWLNEDGCLFSTVDLFYNTKLYYVDENGKSQVIKNSEIEAGYILVSDAKCFGDNVYFLCKKQQSDSDNSSNYRIYRCLLDGSNVECIIEADGVISNWVVVNGDEIIYTIVSNSSEDSLWHFTIGNDAPSCISERVVSFGIVNGNVQFVERSDDFELYSYSLDDMKITSIGSFLMEESEKEEVTFNYTEKRVVFYSSAEYTDKLSVYDIKKDAKTTYTLPKKIESMCCFEEDIYVVLNEDPDDIEKNKTELYKFDYDTGKCKLITEDFSDILSVYATNSDYVYICVNDDDPEGLGSWIYKISANGKCKKMFSV